MPQSEATYTLTLTLNLIGRTAHQAMLRSEATSQKLLKYEVASETGIITGGAAINLNPNLSLNPNPNPDPKWTHHRRSHQLR